MRPDRISLFPLNVVLFPGELLPLHIFEPRYKRMVRTCLDDKTLFGMLLAMPNGVANVGCSAEILEVTKTYDDGRMDILTVGRDPYRVLDLFTKDPLLEGAVDYLEDEPCLLDPECRTRLIDLFEACYTLLFSGMPPNLTHSTAASLAFAIAGALPIDLLWKQQILEIRSEVERQERLLRYLQEWALHLHKIEAQRQSGGDRQNLN